MSKRNNDVPEWARPGLDDPDAYEAPEFSPAGPGKSIARHPEGCRCMTCLLLRLRMILRSEIPTQMHTHAAPVLRDFEGIPDKKWPDEGGIGMPMTAAMHRFLESPEHWGLTRLGMLSIIEVSSWCAAAHPPHRRAMFTRTVCGQLVFEAGYLGQEMEDLIWNHREATDDMPALSPEQISGMLATGLQKAEEWRADKFARWTKVPGAEEPLPERRRVA